MVFQIGHKINLGRKHSKEWILKIATAHRIHPISYHETNKKKKWYREMKMRQRMRWLKKNPWYRHYNLAMQRCIYPYGKYFGKYKLLATIEDFKILWFRDKAWLLKRPSIDRINPDGDYTFNNCRFIEFIENIKRKRKRGKSVARMVA